MTSLLLGVAILLLLFACWRLNQMTYFLNDLVGRPPKKQEEAYITPTNPAFTNENKVGQGDSVIITPKSPQLLEFEEQEELRKMNLRPR